MTITLPSNVRGPILDLALPASEPPVDLQLRNNTTAKTMMLRLPEDWAGDDLVIDFYKRSIKDVNGVDRSALLDSVDNLLWVPEPVIAGINDVEIEAVAGLLVAKDDFNQTAGAVTGKALETGGVWQGSGDADDFAVVAAAEHLLQRTAKTDAPSIGRRIRASTPVIANTRVRFDFIMTGFSGGDQILWGPFARRVGEGEGGETRVQVLMQRTLPPELGGIPIYMFINMAEGTKNNKILAEVQISEADRVAMEAGTKMTCVLEVTGATAKAWFGQYGKLPSRANPMATGTHEFLEGKTRNMSSGQLGINEEYRQANALARKYDRFRAYNMSAKAPYGAKATLRWEKGYY